MKIYKEFKEFALKGNMIDMAVGIIIGAAFSTVVNSIVKDLIMPPLGLIIGKVDFTSFRLILQPSRIDAITGEEIAAVSINYGQFISEMITFLLVALAVFLVIRVINRLKRKEVAEKDIPAPALSAEVELLTQIRDLLKKK